MAIVVNDDTVKADVSAEVDAEINTEAEAATVWFEPGSLPSFIDTSKTDVLSNPLTSTLPGGVTTAIASEVTDLIADNALQSTRFRRAHAGRIGGPDHGINVTALTSAFELNFAEFGTIGADFNIEAGDNIDASNIIAAAASIAALLVTHRTASSVIDVQVCHSSCHVSCHSNRARR